MMKNHHMYIKDFNLNNQLKEFLNLKEIFIQNV